jgi:hypothetical protein
MQGPSAPPTAPTPPYERFAVAPAAPAAAAPAKIATRAQPPEAAPQVARAGNLGPEDLPPELLEHPELFLRLPVVRRLETLEYLGAVHDQPERKDGAG